MRVIHVAATDIDGGAAKGCYKLHGALRKAGVDSLMLVQRKYTDDPSVIPLYGKRSTFYDRIRGRLDLLPLLALGWRRASWWTVGWLPFDISGALARLKPDVVQFHWAGRGAAPIEGLQRLRRYPIIWTLRDMWPLTGGCHYSDGCEKFLVECNRCPQLGSNAPFDLSRWQWRRKHATRRNIPITYIALSNWMADYARRSPLTFGNEVKVIPTGVDTEVFAPADKAVARAGWKLPTDKRVVLFGAINATTDHRKGFTYLREALKRLAGEWADRVVIVVFGAGDTDLDVGMEVRSVGWIGDDATLARLYAAADVMVVPSIQENLGKTALEAMACGVPVAAFNNTGMPDIVDHKTNGYLAQNLSSEDLARGIAWCLEQTAEDDLLAVNARCKVMSRFDIRRVVASHVELYQRLLEGGARADVCANAARYRLVGADFKDVIPEGLASKPVRTQ